MKHFVFNLNSYTFSNSFFSSIKYWILFFVVFTTIETYSQPQSSYYKSCVNILNTIISPEYAKIYFIPLNVYDIPNEAMVTDINVRLKADHEYTNQLEVNLISPFGIKSTLFTVNSCPGSYGLNIDALFDDQAYDLAYYKSTYDSQNKSGVKIPANFTCLSSKKPSIGAYNNGWMRPQGDHLKVFNGTILKENTPAQKISISSSDINISTDQMSGQNIKDLITKLALQPNDKITLLYVGSSGAPINGLETLHYYVFKIINDDTIQLIPLYYESFDSLQPGTNHKFIWTSQWVLSVNDNASLAGGKVKQVDLNITYKPKPNISGNSDIKVTGKVEERNLSDKLDLKFNLEQNYPNPFLSETTIEFTLPYTDYIELSVYNILGQLILNKTGLFENGLNQIILSDLPKNQSGPLLYRLKYSGQTITKTMIHL
ncbi:MAG: T9SS type A sorting domain-containing protein [Saprospiraceae bacterium]|nr:T9SS type A sorting domain-containing protein [Saprospiraceae bacterium]